MRTRLYISWILSFFVLYFSISTASFPGDPQDHLRSVESIGHFQYDRADQSREGQLIDKKNYYDPDVLRVNGTTWITWLEYVPGKGDVIQIGTWTKGKVREKRTIVDTPERRADPTLTAGASGTIWLSYEEQSSNTKRWSINVRRGVHPNRQPQTYQIDRPGQDINHQVSPDPDGGVWIAWQTVQNGQFDIALQRLTNEGLKENRLISPSKQGDWNPDLSVNAEGTVTVAWEHYDGERFNVLYRQIRNKTESNVFVLADSSSFEGNVSLDSDPSGRTWVVWDTGSSNWGDPFRGDEKGWNNVNDAYGPLHRYRTLRIGVISSSGSPHTLKTPLPMPATEHATNRNNVRKGVSLLGTYYERGKLTVDGNGRPWIFYRHFYKPQVGKNEPTEHHQERGWKVYARCLTGNGWSRLYSFTPLQRDGMQRLSNVADDQQITGIWTTGRTDRNKDPHPKGIAISTLQFDAIHPGDPPSDSMLQKHPTESFSESTDTSSESPTETVDGTTYQLVFGDLHRHTDLSLCFPFYDGSIQDAFRYGIEVARLDYLGITDHTRDIAQGNKRSLLWWRSTKEDTRYRIKNHFFTFFSYERSRAGADHNVISLKDNMLDPHTSPVTNIWQQITDRKTFTIPHNTTSSSNEIQRINPKTWTKRPKEPYKRPLAEVYQGLRDQSSLGAIELGWEQDHHIGVIASSDHLATSASYACVWTPNRDRETIFRSLMNRRTYGATDKIYLTFRSGSHWMGEKITVKKRPVFQYRIRGTAPIQSIRILRNGDTVYRQTWDDTGETESVTNRWRPEPDHWNTKEEQYFYVIMKQKDGNKAWSSPIWIQPEQE